MLRIEGNLEWRINEVKLPGVRAGDSHVVEIKRIKVAGAIQD